MEDVTKTKMEEMARALAELEGKFDGLERQRKDDNYTASAEIAALKNDLGAAGATIDELQGRVRQQERTAGTVAVQQGARGIGIKAPTFSDDEGEEWSCFRDAFMGLPAANGWSDLQSKAAIRVSLLGVARTSASGIDDWDNKRFAEIMRELDEIFLPRAASNIAKARFDNAYQGPKETLRSWHSRVQTLHRQGYPNSVEEATKTRKFVTGLRNEAIRQQVLRGDPKTFREALTMAQNEAAVYICDRGATGQNGGSEIAALCNMETGNEPSENDEQKKKLLAAIRNGAQQERACYFCTKPGHLKANCELWLQAKAALGGRGGFRGRGAAGRGRGGFRGRGFPRGRAQRLVAAIQALEESGEDYTEDDFIAALEAEEAFDEGDEDIDPEEKTYIEEDFQ